MDLVHAVAFRSGRMSGHRSHHAGPRMLRILFYWFLVCTCWPGGRMVAQSRAPEIRFDGTTRVFSISAAGMSYVFGVNENGQLQAMYWGKRLGAGDRFAATKAMPEVSGQDLPINTTPQEFMGWGGGLYVEPDLKITSPDGNRDLALKYVSNAIQGDALSVVMKDVSREVYVTLRYEPDAETGILRRSAVIENRTKAPFTMEKVSAATWSLPRGTDYRHRYLSGRWASEWNVHEQPIAPGKTVLESRRGTTGPQNNPWFAIDRMATVGAETGGVWFGALGWSGSGQIAVEQDQLQQVRISGGLNPFDFG